MMTTTKARVLLRSVLASVMLLTLAGGVARAQSLPSGVVSKSELSESDRGAVKAWLDAQTAGLASDDPKVIKASRDAILQPLRSAAASGGVSVSFRTELQKQLYPVLEAHVADKRELVAVNAVRLAGETAHANTLKLVSRALDDERPGVKYAACYAARTTLDAAKVNPAISARDMIVLLGKLGEVGSATTDPRVLEGVVLAMESGSSIPDTTIAGARVQSLTALAGVVNKQVKRLGTNEAPAPMLSGLLRAASVARSVFTDSSTGGQAITGQGGKAMVELAGDLLSLSAKLCDSPAVTGDDRGTLEQMTAAAEAVLVLAMDATGKSAPVAKLSEPLRSGNCDGVKKAADGLLGNSGVVVKAFNFAGDRFKL